MPIKELSEGIANQENDLMFIYPKDLEEDVKFSEGKMNNQISEILMHTQPTKLGQIPVYTKIDEKLLENIGDDPTDTLLDNIQNSIDAERNSVRSNEEWSLDEDRNSSLNNEEWLNMTYGNQEVRESNYRVTRVFDVPVYVSRDTKIGEELAEVLVVPVKAQSSFSPELATKRTTSKDVKMSEKVVRSEDSKVAKNSKKNKLSSQVRAQGKKFRKGEL